jgi:radical SAM superfamily enzyme YgiQ (UPF0313 family)
MKHHDVHVVDMMAEKIDCSVLGKVVADIKPDTVGITSDTLTFQAAIDTAKTVKLAKHDTIVVVGGAHSNVLPAYPLKYDCFDISVYGEGERTAVELWSRLARGESYSDVAGIAFRDGDKIVVNPKRYLIKNLDDIPFPARSLFPMDKYDSKYSPIGTSRGCPFACSFCLPTNTKILMADMSWVNIQDVTIGDKIIGVNQSKQWRYKHGTVLKTFKRSAEVFEITTDKGTVRCTKDHKWLMHDVWKSLQDIEDNAKYNARINSERSELRYVATPQVSIPKTNDYKKGYVSGALLGDGCVRQRTVKRPYGNYSYWQMQLVGDYEMLDQSLEYFHDLGFNSVHQRKFNGGKLYKCNRSVVTEKSGEAEKIHQMIISGDTPEWRRGFLAGIYDAEGGCSGSLRFSNKSVSLKCKIKDALAYFGFDSIIEPNAVLLHGGLPEIIRFFALTSPAVTHKRQAIRDGDRVNCSSPIVKIKSLGEMEVYDIQTTVESFIADGFVTHNCSNNIVWQRTYRFRSSDSVIGEIKAVIAGYGTKKLYFREDLFTANRNRVMELCNKLVESGITIDWECESRVGTIDSEMLLLMKRAGCKLIWFGVESGSQRILDRLNKQTTVPQIVETYRLCKDAGIPAGASFIIGVPGETAEDVNKTASLARKLNPEFAWFNILTGYPTSPLYEYVKENKLYETETEHGILIARTETASRSELEATRRQLDKKVTLRRAFREFSRGTLTPGKILQGVQCMIRRNN